MVFVADDLGAWLVGLLADAGRKKLITVVLGSEQERALRQAAALRPGIHTSAMSQAANYLGYSGSYAGARDLFQQIADGSRQILGDESLPTLNARSNLAYWTGRAGDPARARDQLAALLPIRERVSGADHPYTLTERAHLARWTGEAGNPASARDQFAALLPVEERVLGCDHTETRNTRAGLAHWTAVSEDGL